MESSEDDAGTATNASRRASAREKNVGLAEEVNATISLQQKSSEERSSSETPAMSEDNFDGDSVPSPSSQDVNTSTEAILDMIDEIVDGPDAPKRVPLPSELVDGLNEELATTSHNLNILQESANRHSENITPLEVASSINSALVDNKVMHPGSINTPAECSTPSEIPTISVNTKTVDSLPASSSVSESKEKVVSTKAEESLVSNVLTETSTSCLLPNIPSSSEEQTVQTVSDISVSEPQDRTAKCVTSSDTRDNVIVESAESTSSDSSFSESKALFAEPQTQSPLQRRLIRPAPSDRRPDSTVSSTVDSNTNDSIVTVQQSSSENVAKDVTSSSDAVPTIDGSERLEEICNVSDTNSCQAETSVIPPKKIKLIRQKIGTQFRETPLNTLNVSSEQCQSTSYDNHSANLSISTTESSSTVNCVSEKPLETLSMGKESLHEHSLLTKIQSPPDYDGNHQKSNCDQSLPDKPGSIPVSATDNYKCDELKPNDLEQNYNYNTHENEDYIPLHLPPKSKGLQSKSYDQKFKSEIKPEHSIIDPIAIDLGSKNNDFESSSEQKSQSNQLRPELVSTHCELDSKGSQHELKRDIQSIGSNKESSSSIDESKSIMPESQNMQIEPTSCNTESVCGTHALQTDEPQLECRVPDPWSSESITKSNKSESINSETDSKLSDFKSNCSNPLLRTELISESSKVGTQQELKNVELDSKTTNVISPKSVPSLSSEEQLKCSLHSDVCRSESKDVATEATDNRPESNSKTLALNSEQNPKDLEIKTTQLKDSTSDRSNSYLQSSEIVPTSSSTELQCSQFISQDSEHNMKKFELEAKNKEIKCSTPVSANCIPDVINQKSEEDHKKVPPIKLNLSRSSLGESKADTQHSSINKNNIALEESESTKQIPKVTIKLKPTEELKSPVPKVTIKPIKQPIELVEDSKNNVTVQVPCITKINIKPIIKPDMAIINEKPVKSQSEVDKDSKLSLPEQVPCITKLNIKPIIKPPEKINEIHRKSSSSEISESEYSENDETTSTSDQASTSDQGSSDVVPKVTIKLGKPGTESEGKFYTEKNVPKLTIKGIQQEDKLKISQSEDIQPEKIPKLTIKTVTKSESQPLSPKYNIKPLKPSDSPESQSSKVKISTETFPSSTEGKDSPHVPKITIKPVTRMDGEVRTPKKSHTTAVCDTSEHIRAVTKINIKPIVKPSETGESSESFDEKVPVVSKLNIKPVIKPKDNVDSSVEEVPKITKLNIKPLKSPGENSLEKKDCDELNAVDGDSIPVITKLNIKPIIKPQEEEKEKDSENLSSETGNSSDDNGDHIPIITKLNIKPIMKPEELQDSSKLDSSNEQSIPVITKLNIKPLIKPGESSPSSPKKEHKIDIHSTSIPIVTKLNIKPVIRPEEIEINVKDNEEKLGKNPPLVMKINMKSVAENINHESDNNVNICSDQILSTTSKISFIPSEEEKVLEKKDNKTQESELLKKCLDAKLVVPPLLEKIPKQNCVPESIQKHEENERKSVMKKTNLNATLKVTLDNLHSLKKSNITTHTGQSESLQHDSNSIKDCKISIPNETHISQEQKNINFKCAEMSETTVKQPVGRQNMLSVENCTLLKKLLENTSANVDNKLEVPQTMNCSLSTNRSDSIIRTCKNIMNSDHLVESGQSTSEIKISTTDDKDDKIQRSSTPDKVNDLNRIDSGKFHSIQELTDKVIDNITKPLEINISDKMANQSSGQDSPRIILKINKTDHGPLAKIITEDVKRSDTPEDYSKNTQDIINDKQSPKRHLTNRRKQALDTSLNLSTGKRLRSSRIVESAEKSKGHIGKRPSTAETATENKDSELTVLQTKRLKLGQLLSGNNPSCITPAISPQTSPSKTIVESKAGVKSINHSLLNNENCSKNGNSKLHNILSNLQAKQMQSLSMNKTNCSEKTHNAPSDLDCNASMSSSDTTEVAPVKNSHLELQQMIINENSEFRDLTGTEEISQDPLEVNNVKSTEAIVEVIDTPKPVELTPQPKKRGRPRKLPVSEGAKPIVALPVPALEERPQRSLRLMRDRPAILQKPRGRGRGRGRRGAIAHSVEMPPVTVMSTPEEPVNERTTVDIDPTSSRIKLPRMTEALDNMPSMCNTPLSSRRRNSSETGDIPDLKVTMDGSLPKDDFPHTPEPSSSGRGRGGRGSRGGRGRTPRGRGRGRGGGRGAMYMKETLGIYGRVCGPATTTVQLFEEETCMMDDNATPAKPLHILDEDSQSSCKSLTNESNKMKKSKFADLFDSNKVWTAADVKEYTWLKTDEEQKVMMIQEQVAMFLGVKSFKRRYPELKRRTICGEERDYVLSKGLVTEALCDLGITAVDASDVLDIMLSDYPHKYEEYRSHQRQRQLTGTPEESMEETKPEEKIVKVELKVEKPIEHKPELPKVDPEKTRLDMAAAAIASASEYNARMNAARRGACADLQSLTVLRPRAPPAAPSRPHLQPPTGFYPHALLPGQYQHSYRVYAPDQLRYFPLNTVLAAPPAPVSLTDCSSDSEPDWGSHCTSSDDSDAPTHHSAKRKKLTKVKRASHAEVSTSVVKDEPREEVVDLCRVCKLRLEANRKYTHERFLVCANCNAKLHPSCVDLNADTIRKCREYPWQCAECKTCYSCRLPADDDKMLFCDLCDRGFHIYCVGLDTVPSGRWHCVECAICKSCGARSPGGLTPATPLTPSPASSAAPAPADWHHQTRRGPGGHKVYSHSLCTPCARLR